MSKSEPPKASLSGVLACRATFSRLLPSLIDPKPGQLGPGVLEAIGEMCFERAPSDHPLEAFDLVGDCPTANLNGTIPVWIHAM